MPSSLRSSATLRSQVERGRPGGLLQFSAGRSNKRRHMSAESSIRATCTSPPAERTTAAHGRSSVDVVNRSSGRVALQLV